MGRCVGGKGVILRGKIPKLLPLTIARVKDLCLEAWHINMNHQALNRDNGSYLPQEYLHLGGK